jgi:hypothetical protein
LGLQGLGLGWRLEVRGWVEVRVGWEFRGRSGWVGVRVGVRSDIHGMQPMIH